ncbi:unnamed protein product [marine sediment metagenome]|uniref:Uncharacterized protein n=1 Tax=marine sediment metagenome TaxID=412755 RepID=X1BAE4_9ZZZZ
MAMDIRYITEIGCSITSIALHLNLIERIIFEIKIITICRIVRFINIAGQLKKTPTGSNMKGNKNMADTKMITIEIIYIL